jgi:hypothetical protein
VEETVGGILYRRDHLGMPVSGGRHRDPGHEVQIAVAVHIFHHDAAAPRHHQGVLLDVAGGGPLRISGHDVPSPGTRWRNDDLGIVSCGHGQPSMTVRLCSRMNWAT